MGFDAGFTECSIYTSNSICLHCLCCCKAAALLNFALIRNRRCGVGFPGGVPRISRGAWKKFGACRDPERALMLRSDWVRPWPCQQVNTGSGENFALGSRHFPLTLFSSNRAGVGFDMCRSTAVTGRIFGFTTQVDKGRCESNCKAMRGTRCTVTTMIALKTANCW